MCVYVFMLRIMKFSQPCSWDDVRLGYDGVSWRFETMYCRQVQGSNCQRLIFGCWKSRIQLFLETSGFDYQCRSVI